MQKRSRCCRASRFAVEALEARQLLSVAPAVPGGLNGKILYTHGGHGYVWRAGTFNRWDVMRGYTQGMMEDMGNQDQLTPYANYALRGGATFVSMRPIGHQTNEVIVDNSDAFAAATGGFDTPTGSWSNSTGSTYWSNNDGNDAVHYRTASTALTETATARWTPNIPATGFYPIYGWWNPGDNTAAPNNTNNRASDATFRVNYADGSQEVKVAQSLVGKGWVYLGTYYFEAGVNQSSGSVVLSNKSATTGKNVIADAIRFGNGMGDWTQYGAHPISGQSREDECALYWCYRSLGWSSPGVRLSDDTVDGGSTSEDENKNFSAMARYAAYMNNQNVSGFDDFDRLWMSYHSNAGGGDGTVGLITNDDTPNQAALAALAATTVEAEMKALDAEHEYPWADSADTFAGGYSEIDDSILNSEMDATIIEVAYHDDVEDAALMKDPKVRDEVGRATYHTAIKYFDQFDASFTNITYLPEPVRNLRVTTSAANTNLTVTWQAPLSNAGTTGPRGNAATGYRVWTSANGYGFDLAGTTASTSFTLPGNLSDVTYVRVTATNAGGESAPSVTAGAKPQSSRRAPILIVNNFDRLDRPTDERETHFFGVISRARPRYNNSMDYVVQAANAVESYNSNLGIEYCTDVAIAGGQISLGNYHTVIWMSGEQSTANETFDATTQPLVTSYLNAGGKMFISGAEIAWDLFGQSNETQADRDFLAGTLRATYVSDDAGTYTTAAGIAGTALAGVGALNFDNGTHGTYDVEFADVLEGNGAGASVAMNYSTGAGNGAVIQYASGNTKLLFMGFGFESIYTNSQRNSLMGAVLKYLGTALTLPTGTPDLLATSDTGSSNADNVTNRNNSAGKTLQFSVANTIVGATVQIFAGTTFIGFATATSSTTTVTTNGTSVIADGGTSITAVQTDGVTTSPNSDPLGIMIDTVAPTANVVDITPDPRISGVSSITITFTRAVSGFNLTDLSLTRNGGANLLTGAQTLTTSDNLTFTLNNLSSLTQTAGTYVLTLIAAGSGISETLAGNALVANASDTWTNNLPAWLAPGSVATWESATKVLTVSGAATIIADPFADLPTINASGAAAVLTINPATDLAVRIDALTLTGGATAILTSLGATRTASNHRVLRIAGANLNIDNASTLDLTDNDLIVDYSAPSGVPAAVEADVRSGYNLTGDWLGKGITSSFAAADGNVTLAVADNGALAQPFGTAQSGPLFAGQDLDLTTVLVKFTHRVDMDLDGIVSPNDAAVFSGNYDENGFANWAMGDLDFDGLFTAADAAIMGGFYDESLGAL